MADAALLEDLFADLDATVFDNTTLSSSSPAPRAPRPLAVRPAARSSRSLRASGQHQSPANASTQQPEPRRAPAIHLEPQSISTNMPAEDETLAETQSQTLTDDKGRMFWDDPFARSQVAQLPSSPTRAPASRMASDTRAKELGGHAQARQFKHVDIKVERLCSDENVPPARPPQVKVESPVATVAAPTAVEDFADLVGDIDWTSDAMLSSPPRAKPTPRARPLPQSKQYVRCIVTDISEGLNDSKRFAKILTVTSTSYAGSRVVHLEDDWIQNPLEAGDTINLIGAFDEAASPSMIVNRFHGCLILHPDILVSSTKVGDSAHCARKALLLEIIRTLGGSNASLVYGNMLHELMQASMMEKRWDDEWRQLKIDEIVRREVQTLWSIDLELEKARQDMMEKSKSLTDFHDMFMSSENGKPLATAIISDLHSKSPVPARLAITETMSVEEDIWSPKYGLKGKVDVSVTGAIAEGGPFEPESRTLPFEIKTGRANAGMEHRAQTMLYTLLMSDRYNENVTSGLLYYSQSNSVVRVQAARNELRGLLLARNEFATYLHRRMTLSPANAWAPATQAGPSQAWRSSPLKPKVESAQKPNISVMDEEEAAYWSDEVDDIVRDIEEEPSLLPAPIDDERSCRKCFVKDACMLFRSAVENDNEMATGPDSALQLAFEEKTSFLTQTHKTFFRTWEKLISFEEQELVRFKKEIWTMSADERMKAGRCLANMCIDTDFVPTPSNGTKIHRHTYRMRHAVPLRTQASDSQRAARSLLGGSIAVNDPVIVSLENPHVLGISRGFALEVTARYVVLGLDHPLETTPQAARALPASTQPGDLIFRIDKDELAAGMGRIRDNLIQLFVEGGDERRRRLVVDLEKPEFDIGLLTTDPAATQKLIPEHLNADQQQAVEKVLSARDYALILGMPGTGKTTTIAEILKALAAAGKSVLLTSYTHSAVDNILLKVKDSGLGILRLGNRDKILPALHGFTLDPSKPAESLSQVDNQLMMPQIVATTCLGINEPIFTKRKFDVCIVDEASQVTLPTCLGPLRFADRFVLVGDHNQLPPLVRNPAARKGGLDVSLFKRLSDAHPSAMCYLSHQYRMNDDIMLLSNKLIYQDRLRCGSEEIGQKRLVMPRPEIVREFVAPQQAWLRDVIDPSLSVVFINTDQLPARERRTGSLVENEGEAKIVRHITDALLRCGVAEEDVGVIAVYRQQIKLIQRKLEHVPKVEVLTADRSQGRDKEVIIMSLVRSNEERVVGDLLKDWRRINVCLTRAKTKLVVIGSQSTLQSIPLLQKFFDVVESKGWTYVLPVEAGQLVEGSVWPSPGKGKRPGCGSENDPGKVQNGSSPTVKSSTSSPGSRASHKKMRRGGGALALSSPLSRDILNSL